MRRELVIGLLAGSCLLAAAGCSKKSESAFPAEFSHPQPVSSEQRASAMQAQADYFKKMHPERFKDGKIIGPAGVASGPPPQ
ncbi:hypothetical protein CCAX7_21230 [Capsulimonas corticalis]|uniref:Uncharacterized protein n=1 Tax=Capsulimonas corticalis TaxID=2219043 RepID=A0A402D208_9BACT|nr:hypothetical protein [Capsulimonas corticalis]BDI30072.1 hypothetical protein CCAX7_21230 [Capsulimonas corticalis]